MKMPPIKLYAHQSDAIPQMKNGCILCGGVGSGKSRTSLAYYYISEGYDLENPGPNCVTGPPSDLYIITTARKRDTHEWEQELEPFGFTINDADNPYWNHVRIDSWNNIKKYIDVKGAFFIFDEQRVVGSGSWVKAFLKITAKNSWILLSATPGDTWLDYIPVFIANGFYKNRTEFINEHVIYSRYTKYPKVSKYIGTGKLLKLRNSILIKMKFERETVSHHIDIPVLFDRDHYKEQVVTRWNFRTNAPVRSASELCYELRYIVNSDPDRVDKTIDIWKDKQKVIVFYNYNYELDMLKDAFSGLDCKVAEWNGHEHEEVPSGNSWVYLVQYTAGCEGWNCTVTDTIVFFSQNYSYKVMTQAAGRIDRLNTPFSDLYYYHLKSKSGIDLGISQALARKEKFNEDKFVGSFSWNRDEKYQEKL